MLFAAAETSLKEAEDLEAAAAKARQAWSLFREAGDRVGEADALRLLISAMAETELQETLQEALTLATQELDAFRSASERRGEAAALLSIAELTMNNFGSKKRDDAIEAATKARQIFAELDDAKMEGNSVLALANALITKGRKHDSRPDLEAALKSLARALDIFRGAAQDKYGEAKTLYSFAAAYSYLEELGDALKRGKEALALCQELRVRRLEGMMLRCLAEWEMQERRPQEALVHAKAALALFEELGNSKGWEAAALATAVRATLKAEDTEQALKLAKDGVRRFGANGDGAGEAQALGLIVEVHLAKDGQDHKEDALEAAEKCLEEAQRVSKQDPEQRTFEANMLHVVGQIHMMADDATKALDSCKAALQLLRDVGDRPQQALVLHTICNANINLKEYRDAVKAAIESRDIFRKRGHKRGHAYSCLVCCHAYGARGETNRAISMAKEAQKLFMDTSHRRGEAEASGMLAEVYMARGSFQKGLAAARDARAVFQELGEPTRELEQLFLVAKAAFWVANEGGTPGKIGEKPSSAWEVALKAAQEALSMSRGTGDEASTVAALFSVGQVFVISRRPNDAAKIIEEALPMAQRLEDFRAEANIEVLQSQLSVMTGKDDKAVEPAQRALDIFKEKLADKEGEELAVELIRFVQGGGSGGAAAVQEDGEEGAASAGAITEYQGPTVEDLTATITDVALSLMGVDTLDGDTPLMDAGLDSLASVEFQNTLQKEFQGVEMPSTLVFDYPSVSQMSDFINGGLRESAGFKSIT